jgi:hypothetical protein
MEVVANRKISAPTRNRNLVVQPVASHFPDSTIPSPTHLLLTKKMINAFASKSCKDGAISFTIAVRQLVNDVQGSGRGLI